MHRTQYSEETGTKLTVDIIGLQKLLSTGRATAQKIGDDAGASLKVGRRKLYNVAKIEKYLDTLTES